jgi:hypothetical protein
MASMGATLITIGALGFAMPNANAQSTLVKFENSGESSVLGSGGETPVENKYCGPDQIATGITYVSHDLSDKPLQLGLRCSEVAIENGSATASFVGSTTPITSIGLASPGTTGELQVNCSPGTAMTGISTARNDVAPAYPRYIIRCRSYTVTGGELVGGNASEVRGLLEGDRYPTMASCADGKWVNGHGGSTGVWIDSVKLTCAAVVAPAATTTTVAPAATTTTTTTTAPPTMPRLALNFVPDGEGPTIGDLGIAGNKQPASDCPQNSIVTALRVSNSPDPSRAHRAVRLSCSWITVDGTVATATSAGTAPTFGLQTSNPRGGTVLECPDGFAVTGLAPVQVDYIGSDFGSYGVLCADYAVVDGRFVPGERQARVGVPEFGPYLSFNHGCVGRWMGGIRGRFDVEVQSVKMRCVNVPSGFPARAITNVTFVDDGKSPLDGNPTEGVESEEAPKCPVGTIAIGITTTFEFFQRQPAATTLHCTVVSMVDGELLPWDAQDVADTTKFGPNAYSKVVHLCQRNQAMTAIGRATLNADYLSNLPGFVIQCRNLTLRNGLVVPTGNPTQIGEDFESAPVEFIATCPDKWVNGIAGRLGGRVDSPYVSAVELSCASAYLAPAGEAPVDFRPLEQGTATTTAPPTTAPSTTALPTTEPGTTVEPAQSGDPLIVVVQGGQVNFSVTGFDPSTPVTATMFSTPTPLGTFRTDAAGTVRISASVPTDKDTGMHRIEVVGSRNGQNVTKVQRVELLPATLVNVPDRTPITEPDNLALTGTSTTQVALLGIGALLIGFTLIRRRTSADV